MTKIDLDKAIRKKDIMEDFLRVYNILGYIPSKKDLSENANYAVVVFCHKFGSFENLVKESGLKMKTKETVNKKDLLIELKRVCDNLGRAPSTPELSKKCKYNGNIYCKFFGNISNALKEIGYSANKATKISQQCPICNLKTVSMIAHMTKNHPIELKKQEEFVIGLYKNGLSARKIATRDDHIFNGGTSIARVIRKYLKPEEIEELRRNKIKKTLVADYASGKYDWVNDLNRNRNMTSEAREKNSAGLKKSYEGRDSWNKGQTKETNEILFHSAEKTSKRMKVMFKSGELEKKIGPESSNWNENRDKVGRRYRLGLNFNAKERELIKKRAGYKCEVCGVLQEKLKEQGEMLECDHITPISQNGVNDLENNSQALCPSCHQNKTRKEKGNVR